MYASVENDALICEQTQTHELHQKIVILSLERLKCQFAHHFFLFSFQRTQHVITTKLFLHAEEIQMIVGEMPSEW